MDREASPQRPAVPRLLARNPLRLPRPPGERGDSGHRPAHARPRPEEGGRSGPAPASIRPLRPGRRLPPGRLRVAPPALDRIRIAHRSGDIRPVRPRVRRGQNPPRFHLHHPTARTCCHHFRHGRRSRPLLLHPHGPHGVLGLPQLRPPDGQVEVHRRRLPGQAGGRRFPVRRRPRHLRRDPPGGHHLRPRPAVHRRVRAGCATDHPRRGTSLSGVHRPSGTSGTA